MNPASNFGRARRARGTGRIATSALLLACLLVGAVSAQEAPTTPRVAPSVLARPATGQLPSLGDGSELGAATERRLGDRIAREIYRDPDYLDDPVLVEYVDGIWKPLLAAARVRGDISAELDERFAWEIMLGRDRSINAFALPGGYLGVHLGLIAVVSSRDELASVLAHELSHVTQRHISRLTSKQSEQRPWLIGAMILGALAASKSPDAANALLAGGQAVAIQNQLNFSRDMEREADRVGFGVMTQAGFAPQGFVSMFDKLQQASRLNDNGSFPYLRGHPLTSERIADMQSRQPAGTAGVVEITLEHAMVTARARVLSNPGVDSLRQLMADAAPALVADGPQARQGGALYAGALAAAKLREFPAARNALTRLNGLARATPAAQRLAMLLTAEVAQHAGDPIPDLKPLGRPELFLSAQSQIGRGNAAQAAQSLSAWLSTHPRDAGAWQLLSAASAAQGQALRAIRAEAEARVAQLDFAGALERFKAAQILLRNTQSAGLDHIEASIIDTRTRAVQLLFREQSLER